MDYKWRKWRRKDLLEQNRFTVSYSFGCYCCSHLRAFVLVTNKLNNSKIIVISIFHRIARKSDNFPLICGVMICLRVFSMRCLKSIDVEKISFKCFDKNSKLESSNQRPRNSERQYFATWFSQDHSFFFCFLQSQFSDEFHLLTLYICAFQSSENE